MLADRFLSVSVSIGTNVSNESAFSKFQWLAQLEQKHYGKHIGDITFTFCFYHHVTTTKNLDSLTDFHK